MYDWETKLEYRLEGFSNLELSDNYEYDVEHNCVESFCFDNKFTKLNITLRDGVEYEAKQEIIDMKSSEIFLALLLTLKNCDSVVRLRIPPKVIQPDIVEESQDDKIILSNGVSTALTIEIRATFTCYFSSTTIYTKIDEKDFNVENHPLKYKKLQSILENSNTAVKYMMLYEMLLSLLALDGNHPSQKRVTEFFRRKNNDDVSFLQTRKNGEDYEEDSFTYLRNQLGHAEDTEDVELYKTLGEEVTVHKIIQIVKAINDCLVERN